MKKILTISLLTLFFASAHAQDIFVRGSIGLDQWRYKFSSNYQDVFIQNTGATYDAQKRSGFQGGLGFGIAFDDHVSVLLEAHYVQKGSKWTTQETYEVTVTDRSGSTSTVLGFPIWNERVNAIHVPLLLRVRPFNGRFSPTIAIGPSFNVAFSGKGGAVIETQDKTYPNGEYTLKFGSGRTDDYKAFDLSIDIRPGLVFNIDEDGIMKLTLDANFSIGLMDMVSEGRKDFLAAGGIDMLGSQKNRGTLFNLGFEFCPACE